MTRKVVDRQGKVRSGKLVKVKVEIEFTSRSSQSRSSQVKSSQGWVGSSSKRVLLIKTCVA
jgi:hypothetical protein